MATYNLAGYSPTHLDYNSTTGEFELSPTYDPATDALRFEFSDDDAFIDGDTANAAIGDDANQTAVVYDALGNVVASGQIYAEAYADVLDAFGNTITLYRMEIGDVRIGYVTTAPLNAGQSYPLSFSDQVTTTNQMQYSDFVAAPPCFGPGVMVQTDQGDMPVEWLSVGDLVMTRDHGFQPIRWIGSSRYTATEVARAVALQPVTLPAGALAPGQPREDTLLSRQHRILMAGADVELLFGTAECLAPAHVLCHASPEPASAITYTHIAFDRHEIILANGAWMESLLTADQAMAAVSPAARSALFSALGLRALTMQAARLCLKPYEARLLNAARYRQERDQADARSVFHA